MRDRDCVDFLQWALPREGFRWPGFRRVRRQVCRRLGERLAELELRSLDDYRRRLEEDPGERRAFTRLCRITISRFFRHRHFFQVLGREVLPALLEDREGGRPLAAWSAGCGAGEEPYSLEILVAHHPALRDRDACLEILGTDVDGHQLARAREGVYPASALKEVPESWREAAFTPAGGNRFRLRESYREDVSFRRQDLRRERLSGPFDLILCRNLAFTYFSREVQEEILAALVRRLAPGGVLGVGSHEELPGSPAGLEPWPAEPSLLRRASDASNA